MAKTQILEYTINFDDKAVADRLIAALAAGAPTVETGALIVYPGGTKTGIYRAPDGAAIEFANLVGAVPFGIIEVGQPIPAHDGGYITGPWFSSSNTFPRDVQTFQRSTGWWIFGSNTRFYWAAQVAWAPPAAAPTPATATEEPTEPAPMATRRAISSGQLIPQQSGFGTTAESQNAAFSLAAVRGASRLGGGAGWGMGNDSGAVQEISWNHQNSPKKRWERFYFRAPYAPSATTGIWRGQNAGQNGQGWGLAVTTNLQLAVYDYSGASTFTVVGTFLQLEAARWYKFDIIASVDAPASTMTMRVFVNGEEITSYTRTANGATEALRNLTRTEIGESVNNTTDALFEFDSYITSTVPITLDPEVEDWDPGTAYTTGDYVRVGTTTYRALQNSTGEAPGVADPPGSTTFPWWRKLVHPIDFQQGSHVQFVPPSAFAASHGAWTGDVRLLMQRGDQTTKLSITSASSGALCAVETNLARDVEQIPGFLGWAAAQIFSFDLRAGAASGSLGYQLGSASAPVDVAITQTTSLAWHSIIYAPVDLAEPIAAGETLELRFTKAANANTDRIASLTAYVEVIGRFGPEDDPVAESSGASSAASDAVATADEHYPNGFHNAQYPYSPWHLDRGALGPIVVVGGTYVGNSLGTTLSFPVPPVFLWVRATSADSGASLYFPTAFEGHLGGDNGAGWTGVTRLEQDDTFVDSDPDADQQMSFDVHIAGSQGQWNNTGVTYQYIAFCDPAARFTRAGQFRLNDLKCPVDYPIGDPEFLPEVLFGWQEAMGTGTTDSLHWQTPGHAAGSMQLLSASTTITSALTMAAGVLTVGDNWVSTSFQNYSYLGFRRADGNDHPDQAKVMFLGTYTGDGAASRTIGLAPASGLRPLFCLVVPANGTGVYRDPTHTTNTSSSMSGGSTTTTGITAGGIDSFTVGSTLNTNGIVFNYFGFYGSATAGNGGWSGNGTYTPVPSDSPFPSDWSEPVPLELPGASSSAAPTPPPEQPDLDETTALPNTTLFCLDYSTRIVNRALGRIGSSKQVVDLATDTTNQAIVARLHLKDDVEATLRLFPWAFATAYAELVLHSGSESDPVNEDWQYAYMAPTDLVFARRIVSQSGKRRRYDRNPIVFRLGLDQVDGHLIYCNERIVSADVPLVLEYTRRVGCPAYFGDALFREALVWKVASSLAAALAKDAAKAEFCLNAFEAFRGKAQTAAANEQQPEQGTTGGDAEWISGRGDLSDDADWIRGR